MFLSQVEEDLFFSLKHLLAAEGFYALPQLRQFRRDTREGFQNIVLSSSKYESDLMVKVHLGSRLNLVEDWVQQFLHTSLTYRPNSNTIITDFGKLYEQKHFCYRISNTSDFDHTVADFNKRMDEQGNRFLIKVSRVRKVNRLLNACPNEKSDYYIHNHIHRYFKALTVARICNHPHFLGLIETYYGFLLKSKVPESVLADYDKLTSFLLHFSFN